MGQGNYRHFLLFPACFLLLKTRSIVEDTFSLILILEKSNIGCSGNEHTEIKCFLVISQNNANFVYPSYVSFLSLQEQILEIKVLEVLMDKRKCNKRHFLLVYSRQKQPKSVIKPNKIQFGFQI